LILADAVDGPCVPVEEIKNKFHLENLHRRWHILPCSGITGFNIDDGILPFLSLLFVCLFICLFLLSCTSLGDFSVWLVFSLKGFKWIIHQAQEHRKELKNKNFHNQHDDYHYVDDQVKQDAK
jgi:hypothetical protein